MEVAGLQRAHHLEEGSLTGWKPAGASRQPTYTFSMRGPTPNGSCDTNTAAAQQSFRRTSAKQYLSHANTTFEIGAGFITRKSPSLGSIR